MEDLLTELDDALVPHVLLLDIGLPGISGTEAGTVQLVDIRPGTSVSSSPASLTLVGDYVYFAANDGTHGIELWRTDGTTAGT